MQVQLPNLDPAKQYAADFRMQATSYAAYMMVRDYQTVRVLRSSPAVLPACWHGSGSTAVAVMCTSMVLQPGAYVHARLPGTSAAGTDIRQTRTAAVGWSCAIGLFLC